MIRNSNTSFLLKNLYFLLGVCCLAILLPLEASAQNQQQRYFGQGHPFEISDLPPSRLKTALTPKYRNGAESQKIKKAKAWLDQFLFTTGDLEHLEVNEVGNVFYADTFGSLASRRSSLQNKSKYNAPLSEAAKRVFALESKPGSSNVLYLDFNGGKLQNGWWNAFNRPAIFRARGYDMDGNHQAFNNAERNAIADIWLRVANSFAAFNINVTTKPPARFTSTTGWVLFASKVDIDGRPMPATVSSDGTRRPVQGVAVPNAWGNQRFHYYLPAIVYTDNADQGRRDVLRSDILAMIAAHEVGHNLSLSHDGHTSQGAYYYGHGNGKTSWAPLMGAGYGKQVLQWSKGSYAGANNFQDDIGIIKNRLGLRRDDHSNSRRQSRSYLSIASDGKLKSFSLNEDPLQRRSFNRGTLENTYDRDWFRFWTKGGTVDISALPYRGVDLSGPSASADLRMSLVNESGATVAIGSNNWSSTARIKKWIPTGQYYLMVHGEGSNVSPYTRYGSIGQYLIRGNIPR